LPPFQPQRYAINAIHPASSTLLNSGGLNSYHYNLLIVPFFQPASNCVDRAGRPLCASAAFAEPASAAFCPVNRAAA